jgi:glycosyltransferase involved in cell wall biosynthesis
MDKVDIILATYNGEKYLAEQLDSIIAQNYSNWRLLISDDGSFDKTLAIIEKYTKADERILLVNNIRQGGVVRNFSKALEFVTSNYIMFSDQDDYWLPEKISHLKRILEEKEKLMGALPLLVFSDLIVVDEDLKILMPSFFIGTGWRPTYNFDTRFLLWRSTVYGCTVMFNKSLYDVAVPFDPDVTMHDQWFALIASLKGQVIYSKESHVYYRQHANNVVGAKERTFFARLKGFFTSISKIKNAALLTNRTVIRLYGEKEKIFLYKLKFVKKNIKPYFHTAKIYSVFFVFFYLTNKVE